MTNSPVTVTRKSYNGTEISISVDQIGDRVFVTTRFYDQLVQQHRERTVNLSVDEWATLNEGVQR